MANLSFFQSRTTANKKPIKRIKFTDEEDREILDLITKYGTNAWSQVAEAMSSQRTKRQVRERWQNYICPELDPQYTEMEDQLLETLYLQNGPQWAKIAVIIGKKSGISARNRYRCLQSMKSRGSKPDYNPGDSSVKISDSPVGFDDLGFPMNVNGFDDSWQCECDELP
jgi:hypothetical protein